MFHHRPPSASPLPSSPPHHHNHHPHIPLLAHLHNLSGPQRWIGAVEDAWTMYSDNPSDYTLTHPIGYGASSVVWHAHFRPSSSSSSLPSHPHPPAQTGESIACAIKVIDLDSLPPAPLALLTRETRLMSLSKHPNVLRVRGSWVQGSRLCIAMRLMRKGSVGDLIRYAHQGGMPEEVCKCILRQALEGLNYLHTNGFIHRDVKAANLLIDDDGTVLLGDLGVAASVLDDAASASGARSGSGSGAGAGGGGGGEGRAKRKRSFVGTPSWMAPEVVGRQAYDSSADIWSFGILALEMTSGRAPGSRDPPGKILLKTLQNAPPTLDRDSGPHKYSKAFKEFVESCLQKDPSLRPSAAQLLQSPFFKSAKRKAYLVSTVLEGLPPIERRLERRRANSIPSIRTSHSSWDFSHSQTQFSNRDLSLSAGLRGTSPATVASKRESVHSHTHQSPSSLRKRYSWDGGASPLSGNDLRPPTGLGISPRDESALEDSSDEEEEEEDAVWPGQHTPRDPAPIRLMPPTPPLQSGAGGSEGSASGARTPTAPLSRAGSKSEGQAGAGAQGLLGKFRRRLSSTGGRGEGREKERSTVVGFLRQVSGTGGKK